MYGNIIKAKPVSVIFRNKYEYPVNMLTNKPTSQIFENELLIETSFGLFRISGMEFIKFYGTSVRFDTYVRI